MLDGSQEPRRNLKTSNEIRLGNVKQSAFCRRCRLASAHDPDALFEGARVGRKRCVHDGRSGGKPAGREAEDASGAVVRLSQASARELTDTIAHGTCERVPAAGELCCGQAPTAKSCCASWPRSRRCVATRDGAYRARGGGTAQPRGRRGARVFQPLHRCRPRRDPALRVLLSDRLPATSGRWPGARRSGPARHRARATACSSPRITSASLFEVMAGLVRGDFATLAGEQRTLLRPPHRAMGAARFMADIAAAPIGAVLSRGGAGSARSGSRSSGGLAS